MRLDRLLRSQRRSGWPSTGERLVGVAGQLGGAAPFPGPGFYESRCRLEKRVGDHATAYEHAVGDELASLV